MAHRDCPLCGDPLQDAPAIHDVTQCEKTELLKGRNKILKLNESLASWKDAWFQLRDIIGKLWWHHPAIDNDEQRAYYQNNLQAIANSKMVTYDGFIAKEGDWHYQAWINKT